MKQKMNAAMEGRIVIRDVTEKDNPIILVEKNNAVNYEVASLALANSIANRGTGFLWAMCFGNGGATVDSTGVITYLPPNVTGLSAALYNQTYQKIVDDRSAANTDPLRNRMVVNHVVGATYTDVLVQCLLDYAEPAGQAAFDNSTQLDSDYVFDELGLLAYFGTDNSGTPITRLMTHVIFHPVQKSLNRQIAIDYTLRINALTNVTAG